MSAEHQRRYKEHHPDRVKASAARWRRNNGTPVQTFVNREARFWAKVDKSGECWLWRGARVTQHGYGQFWDGTRNVVAHRYAFSLVRPIPVGMTLDHLCRNRGCVNPAHLEPVTLRENILRGTSPSAAHARKTHCPAGHPYAGDNLLVRRLSTGRVGRECRECRDVKQWNRYATHRSLSREVERPG